MHNAGQLQICIILIHIFNIYSYGQGGLAYKPNRLVWSSKLSCLYRKDV